MFVIQPYNMTTMFFTSKKRISHRDLLSLSYLHDDIFLKNSKEFIA